MTFLVVGSGGREHALVRALNKAPSVTKVLAVPGSDGMAKEAECHSFSLDDGNAWSAFLNSTPVDCVVIGPEVPLADGLADQLRAKGIAVVGPERRAAKLEASKIFAKEFMVQAGVKTAPFEIVSTTRETLEAAKKFTPPYVLKADGLAAGKGVFICATTRELETAANQLFVEKIFGSAGSQALLEQFQSGYELSYLVLTNGRDFEPLPLAQDHKRLQDNDQGPNTGGMGVAAPVSIAASLRDTIHQTIVQPTLRQIAQTGLIYRGVIYFGLMMTSEGPSLLEYNVRFGDPEAQVILPLLEGDWGHVFKALALGQLQPLQWKKGFATCVVLAAEGYPENPKKGVAIEGSIDSETPDRYFLHAGTQLKSGQYVTAGGRVLNAIGSGETLTEALKNAYAQVEQVRWPGCQFRKDIGGKLT